MKPRLIPARELGLMKTMVSLQDPVVTLTPWEGDFPTLCIEEGGVTVELEFPDLEAFIRFRQRLARLTTRARKFDQSINDEVEEVS